ncbi:MAG: DUF4159 domain-containing protein [Verrucomicrobia bacterium]|nr:DUF4159 domain-containing protein [Verrucomicrobiota bacterium]
MSPRHTTSEVRRNLIGRLARSRDFSISLILHLILVVSFGSRILYVAVHEPPEISSGDEQFVQPQAAANPAPKHESPAPEIPDLIKQPSQQPSIQDIITHLPPPQESAPPIGDMALKTPAGLDPAISRPLPAPDAGQIPREQMAAMKEFREDWVKPSSGGRPPEYQFTAYIGQYAKGDWNSTNLVANNKVENGSLPNLLYFMSAFSNSKVKTNYQNVKAIRLDSDELFSEKPPFIFLTGTRDFELSPQEIENLRKYLMIGGAIWGDSSVPGKNSRFDIAFRREMKKVVGNVDSGWERLPAQHPVFTKAFFPEVRDVPAGLNSYRDPVEVLKIHGEIAVVYTANDYGNMWQVGLDKSGKIDLRRNEKGAFVATNEKIWDNRGTYLRNLTEDSLKQSYKFGTNIVIHLLTRWENLNTGASRL